MTESAACCLLDFLQGFIKYNMMRLMNEQQEPPVDGRAEAATEGCPRVGYTLDCHLNLAADHQ